MKTEYLQFTDDDLELAARLINDGQLVAFPTETVYGLGANALDEKAVESIFVAKGRPQDNPLIVHVANTSDIEKVAVLNDDAQKIIENLMPSSLTIVLKKLPIVPNCVTAGLDTVAVRMPKLQSARMFIEKCGVPIAAPSANTSTRPSPTNWQTVRDDLDGKISAVLCGEQCEVGIESTVLDLTGDTPLILRPGVVTANQIGKVLNKKVKVLSDTNAKVNSPGVRYKHYAPSCEVILNLDGDREKIEAHYKKQIELGKNPILLVSDIDQWKDHCVYSLGKTDVAVANRLYDALRFAEKRNDYIIIVFDRSGELADSILNRLTKASGGNIL